LISLGVDIGGTGVKCAAFSDSGDQLSLQYLEYPNTAGKTNLDPAVLWDSVVSVVRACVLKLPAQKEIAAIAVSSFGESFVPIASDGTVLSDIIMYYANTKNDQFNQVVEKIGEENLMRITHLLPDASYSLSKMLLTNHDVQQHVWQFLPIASFICYCLCGVSAVDDSLASRTMVYDLNKREWSGTILDASGIQQHQLPPICDAGTILGTIKPDVARALNVPSDMKVVFGAHDQIVNALACGIAKPGEGVNVTGTTECITPLFSEIPKGFSFTRDNYACVPYIDNAGFATYAYNLSGGSVVRWFRDSLAKHLSAQAKAEQVSVYDLLNRLCPEEPTDLIALPFLQGMGGTPDMELNAQGMFYGITMQTQLPDFYRAILEGLSFEMAYNLEKLENHGIAPKRLYACGGGARSNVWLQIKANIWNREIIPVLTEETGTLGCAILGLSAVTGQKNRLSLAKQFAQTADPVLPDAASVGFYRKKYETYKVFREAITGFLAKGAIP